MSVDDRDYMQEGGADSKVRNAAYEPRMFRRIPGNAEFWDRVRGRRTGWLRSVILFVVIVGTGAALVLDGSGVDAEGAAKELWDRAEKQAFKAKGYVSGRFGKGGCEAVPMPAKLETRWSVPDGSSGGRLVEYLNNTGEPLLVRIYRGSGGPLEASLLVGPGERAVLPGMSTEDELVVQMAGTRWCGAERGWADGQVVEVEVGGWRQLMALNFAKNTDGELSITAMPWEISRSIAGAGDGRRQVQSDTGSVNEQLRTSTGPRANREGMMGLMGEHQSQVRQQEQPQTQQQPTQLQPRQQQTQVAQAQQMGRPGVVVAKVQQAASSSTRSGEVRQQSTLQQPPVKKLALQPSQTEIENAKRARERAAMAAMAGPAEANEQLAMMGSVRTQDWRDLPPREIRLVTNGSRLYVGGKVGGEDVQFLLRSDSVSAISEEMARRVGGSECRAGRWLVMQSVWTSCQKVVPSLSIGNVTLENVAVAVVQGNQQPILGWDLVGRGARVFRGMDGNYLSIGR